MVYSPDYEHLINIENHNLTLIRKSNLVLILTEKLAFSEVSLTRLPSQNPWLIINLAFTAQDYKFPIHEDSPNKLNAFLHGDFQGF